jgi:hypothetical protein
MQTTQALHPVHRPLVSHPAVVSFTTAATSLMRQMAIKPYRPRTRQREFALGRDVASLHAVHNQVFRERGTGRIPTIVIGGFVPDATEAVEFQRPLFKGYGSIYYLNYARTGFSRQMFFAQLADLIEDINRQGEKPVIFGISFGCGLISQFLASPVNDAGLRIKGVVLASPVLCTEDLVRPEREKGSGVRMIESNLKRILKTDAGNEEDVSRQIERARRCFQSLFEAGAANRRLNRRHLSIRKQIMEAVERTPAAGGYERVLALKDFAPPCPERQIFAGPALLLLAEREEDILVPASPTLRALRDQETRTSLFPRGKVKTVFSRTPEDGVAHASLIFHHHCYNPLIEAWYDKLRAPLLFAAV